MVDREEAPQLEVIATTLADGVAAARGGADRIEVVSAMEDDGLLPDLHLVRRLRDEIALPLRVMLRRRPDFTTDASDLDTLCRAAEGLRAIGVDQFVFGFLTVDGRLDWEALRSLSAAVKPGTWTLHRAFDHAAGAAEAFGRCASTPGLDLILTAGSPAGIDAGMSTVCERAGWQTDTLRWMAGGGLRFAHVAALRAAGIRQFHAGRAARRGQRWDAPVDAALVRRLKHAIAD